ncbi:MULTISPECIES: sugar kinase [Rhizobium]|uniref:Sugar kinase n=1 Tax=Rhizobium bangladeshense TaxID=1138189 RepID=A0ABS7LI04_9HYPH|nr:MULTISPECIES: sugar kinase [Rhizobium]MBX4867306.1 sugar kinase [Rhizobium bangladeshense]MBX4871597.1 sugar kinase [Rhizobium bangladeshense]MBX4882911.1 sugar kinase [Rhizobium bangladeshense]MBX4901040.1 sugar kinase [Rhizobium bangladeshense]MBX4915749.1 sugar kinase [Rhizobium bangladeshense]
MPASDERKIILVVRPTRLDELIARFNTVQQAQFYVEHLGADFSDYLAEKKRYETAITEVEASLRAVARVQRLDRRYLASFVFGPDDVIVVLGQDGLVANTLKYLDGQPVLGVNPDPERWDGLLLPFNPRSLPKVIGEALKHKRPIKRVSMAKATLNTGAVIHAVNDLFIGPQSHVSARYILHAEEREERQSSSGIIVSTGMGSTGWLKSLYSGCLGAASALGLEPADRKIDMSFAWDADYLRYFVREPFPSRTTGTSIVAGIVSEDQPLTIVSEMPEHGVIFSDGIEADFLEFNAGTRAEVTLAERQGMLVV